MTVFRAATTFSKKGNGDIIAEMNHSIAYIQAGYCFPEVSEYYNMKFLVSPDLNYAEVHLEYHDKESFQAWLDIFGEIVEELMIEMEADFQPLNITVTRYIENAAMYNIPKALDYNLFTSKL